MEFGFVGKFVNRPMVKGRRKFGRGITLAETLIAATILSVATTGAVIPMFAGAASQSYAAEQVIAAGLASDMMSRVCVTDFDDVSSWDGYIEQQGMLTDSAGAVITDSAYADFSREVQCSYVYTGQQSRSEDACFVLVKVYVYEGSNVVAELKRLLTRL
jgi:Tfp pilus assembly protein PilV